MISSKLYVLYDYHEVLVTRLGVCVQNKTERKLDRLLAFYYDVLLLTTAYSAYAVHFSLGQFPNMELMLLLLSPLFYLMNCYIFCDCITSVVILYKPLFSRTVIFAFLDFCGNSRVVNFAIFLMLSLL